MHVFPAREKDEVVHDRNGKPVLKLTKTPYTWSGHLEATTDEAQISAWFNTWPEALVGVATGKSRIVVADIDMGADDKTGEVHDGWGSLAEAGLDDLPETVTYQTKRGGDHYVYTDDESIPLGPTQNHETPDGVKLADVDRRGGSSYIIWWADEVPESRDAFQPAPAWLLTPAREASVNPAQQFSGSIEEWLDKCQEGEPSHELRGYLDEMVDKQGTITHQEMIDFQRYLVGIAADRLEPGVPEVLRAFRELYVDYPAAGGEDWGREYDMGLAGAIKKYGQFAQSPRDILEREKGTAWLTNAKGRLLELLISVPSDPRPENLRNRIAFLMSQAIGEGWDVLDAATLGWASAAAKATGGIREALSQEEALADVWNLAWQVAAKPLLEEQVNVDGEPAPEPEPELLPTRSVALLSDAEAAHVLSVEWWGTEFMARMREWNDPINEQYFHLSMWIILSLAFAPSAHLLTKNGTKIPLNFYGCVVGPSDSGKSESFGIIRQVVDVLEMGNDWDLGGDATPAGLTAGLTYRYNNGGGATLLHPDEADATLRDWSDTRGPFAGMKQRITDIYMGRVPKMQRSTNKDISGVAVEAQMCVHLTGVKEKIAEAILPHDWESGFINRFVFAMGTKSRLTDEQLEVDLLDDEGSVTDRSGVMKWVGTWTAQFRGVIAWLNQAGESGVRIGQHDDVRRRHAETRKEFQRIATRKPGYEDRLMATFGRLHVTILKCAALVAITKKRRRIEMDDYLIALRQAEEWAANIMTMVEATDESPRSRQVQRLWQHLHEAGGRMQLSAIHRSAAYRGDQKHTNGLVDELIAQGRAERITPDRTDSTNTVIRLLKEEA